MGRDDPGRDSSIAILNTARAITGEWILVDGGSIRAKCFKIGTLHLEVHPEIASRLNSILAFLHPAAIPAQHRQPLRQQCKSSFNPDFLVERTFSNAVAGLMGSIVDFERFVIIDGLRQQVDRIPVPNAVCLPSGKFESSRYAIDELTQLLSALGGVRMSEGKGQLPYWQFDFYALNLIHEVAAQGYLPERKSHQFYPTPPQLAERLVNWLDIQEADATLEPEAGQGGIADFLPKNQTTCVEISGLHCKILEAKGHRATQADFMEWSPGHNFDVIAMNPPYSEGRWQAHLKRAGELLAPGGRIGAVLPLTARAKAADLLPGLELEFSESIDNAFAGTSISVLLLKGVRPKA